jgi:protein-S-isoprenylcysteine O-methyltransferase Ste14
MSASPVETIGLGRTQRLRKLALLIAAITTAAMLPFMRSWPDEGALHESIEVFGMFSIVLAVVGRCWCTLYIGGRKRKEIVDIGPYSISRNPLYLFSMIGIVGLGAQTGSLALALILLTVAIAIFLPVIMKEEEALRRDFGSGYTAYCARVPRFGPRFSTWQDSEIVAARPRLFWITAREGLLLLLVIPLCESIEWLQDAGWFVPFIRLP